nr:FG-GAP-like repeat-containing protein [Nocardioides perillae]
MGFVHHTVNANDYTAADVPALLRGIYAYHTRSRGWSDIGYNFLVDRFGRIWEGRAGGVERAVVGAHTRGFNEDSFAMSALGNFETTRPTQAMLDAYTSLFAWKLDLHGVMRSGRVTVDGNSFDVVSGHSDADSTACPGRYLYQRLADIRARVAAATPEPSRPPTEGPPTSSTPPVPTRQVLGSPIADVLLRDPGTKRLQVLPGGGGLVFAAPAPIDGVPAGARLVLAPGDLNRDGRRDLVLEVDGVLRSYLSTRRGPLRAGPRVDDLRGLDQLVGAGDVDRDGFADVLGRRSDGSVVLLSGQRGGALTRSRLMRTDWSDISTATPLADHDGDGMWEVLLTRDGRAWTHDIGARRLGDPVPVPGSWPFNAIASGVDLTLDGHPDLVARRPGGALVILPGRPGGGWTSAVGAVPGLRDVTPVALGRWGRRTTRNASVLATAPSGDLVLLSRVGRADVEPAVRTRVSLRRARAVLSAGDWDLDGDGDVAFLRGDDRVLLVPGNGEGGFDAPKLLAGNPKGLTQVRGAGDLTGDRWPDVVGISNGRTVIAPGRGLGRFRRSIDLGPAARHLAGTVQWDRDRKPDLVQVSAGGQVRLRRGTGTGRFGAARVVGRVPRWAIDVIAAGDLTGDGRADLLLLRSSSSGADLWLLPRSGPRFSGLRRLAAPSAADLVG